MKESTVTFTAAPMDADAVSDLHHELWSALINLPVHRHRNSSKYCATCIARAHVTKAYRMLPSHDFRAFAHLPECHDAETCQCISQGMTLSEWQSKRRVANG